MKTELVETALRVLVAWNSGRIPILAGLEILRKRIPSSAHLPADELACQVIHDLCGTPLVRGRDRQEKPSRTEVA
jgi:hypothetical protein